MKETALNHGLPNIYNEESKSLLMDLVDMIGPELASVTYITNNGLMHNDRLMVPGSVLIISSGNERLMSW